VTPLHRELHWLRMSQRIDYKLAVLVYRCINGLAPSYLASDLQPGGVFARHQQAHSSCLRPACQLSVTARFRWLRLVCGTVCRLMSLRRRHCRHARDGCRHNCLLGAIHSSGRVWHITFYCSRCSHVLSFLSFFL